MNSKSLLGLQFYGSIISVYNLPERDLLPICVGVSEFHISGYVKLKFILEHALWRSYRTVLCRYGNQRREFPQEVRENTNNDMVHAHERAPELLVHTAEEKDTHQHSPVLDTSQMIFVDFYG